jgi:hypothetical protein
MFIPDLDDGKRFARIYFCLWGRVGGFGGGGGGGGRTSSSQPQSRQSEKLFL